MTYIREDRGKGKSNASIIIYVIQSTWINFLAATHYISTSSSIQQVLASKSIRMSSSKDGASDPNIQEYVRAKADVV